MNILALDASSKSTGWAVAKDKELIDYGCITSFSKDPIKRIVIMRDGLEEIIKKYEINYVVMEDVQGDYGNSRTKTVLTWLQGTILILLYEINPKTEIELIQASSWRSKIGIHTGRGIKRQELKEKDIEYVKNKYGIDANDDICDAICILDSYLYGADSAF